MKHRIAAVSAVLLVLAACGGGDVSTADARRIVVSGLIDAGQPPDVAACVADAALEQHSPGELVNSSGTTSAEVNASVAGIVADCAASLSPPTTPPAATVPDPTPPVTAPAGPLDPAVCTASHAVLVVLDAADLMDDPGPAAFEAWIDEAADRTELAVLTAPDGELREIHMGLRAAIEELRALAEATGYNSSAPDQGGAADAIGTDLDTLGADLADTLEAGECAIDLADQTAAEALAAELSALDVPTTTSPTTTSPTTTPTTVPVTDVLVEHGASGIRVSVPAEWSGETGGVADTKYGPATRFLVRAPDPAVFDEGRFDGAGTAIYARDGTVDFNAMLAVSGPVQACTFASEQPYDDGVYVGIRRDYTNCAGTPVAIVVIGAADDDAQISTYVEIRVPSLDERAVNVVLNSFYV